jgi:hypothetical protein
MADKHANKTPAMLRDLADDIEKGVHGKVHAAAVVLESEGFPVFGFGETGEGMSNVSELFSLAHHKMVMLRLESRE